MKKFNIPLDRVVRHYDITGKLCPGVIGWNDATEVYDKATGKMLVCVNKAWYRPTDVDNLWGDPTKAKTVLGWNPQTTSYEQLVTIMATHDRELAKKEKANK